MKKALFVFALIALASASFAAVSITDWEVFNWNTLVFDSDESFIRDAEPNGFDLYMNPDDRPAYKNTYFRSDDISDRTYDENGEFTVTITGFEDIYEYYYGVKNISVILNGENHKARGYLAEYTGAGTYKFNSGNAHTYFELSTVTRLPT